MLAILGAFGGCALSGIIASRALRLRHETLQAFAVSIGQLAMLMDYTAQPLDVLADRLKKDETALFWETLSQTLKDQEDVPSAWREAMEQTRKQDAGFAALQEEELRVCMDFAQTLGTTDRKTQKHNAELLRQRVEAILEQTQACYQRKGRMYRSMGVLCGLAVAILLW